MDIATATFDELKQARDEIDTRLRELERTAIEELEPRAMQFGYTIYRHNAAPVNVPRKPTYRNPDDHTQTYSGKGKRPAWLVEKIEQGHTLAEFAF